MSIEKIVKGADIFVDNRGEISNYYLIDFINTVGLIKTKAGSMRSNHYHPQQEQKLLLVSGSYISIYKDLNNKDSPIKHHLIKAGDFVITPPMVAHTTIYLEDSIVINLVNGDRLLENYNSHTIKYELVTEEDKQKYVELYLNI